MKSCFIIQNMLYSVADYIFSVSLPGGFEADALLPSFRTFHCGEAADKNKLFSFNAFSADEMPVCERGELLDESVNDMGLLRLFVLPESYLVEVTPVSGVMTHFLWTSKDFSSVRAYLRWDDPYVSQVLSSLLRIAFSQAVLLHGGISIHASAVCLDGRAYLFMGKSGTGKSTHARLWLEHFPGSFLLNDDNPTVRVKGNEVIAYGTPWSGKTPCYRNQSCPVAGMVRLFQAPVNRFVLRHDVGALLTVYPGCSVIMRDARLNASLQDTLSALVENVKIGILECLPDRQAALLCRKSLY